MTAPPEVTSVLEETLTAIAFIVGGLAVLGGTIVAAVRKKPPAP